MLQKVASRGTDDGIRGWQAAAMLAPALGSFLFNRVVRGILMRLARMRKPPREDWRTVSEMLRQPAALPYVMVTGPRWNTHAAIAGLGPIDVRSSLTLDVACAARSAQMWTLVIYESSTLRTIAAIDGTQVDPDGAGSEWRLAPGRYALILRYYHPGPDAMLPGVVIDGRPMIGARALPDERAYLEQIRGQDGLLYLWLQYYAYALVRCRRFVPEAVVRRHFLPVGNPETQFLFGAVSRDDILTIDVSQAGADGHGVYVTVYNRASFPLFWAEIEGARYTSGVMPCSGTFLIRIHRALRSAPVLDLAHVAVTVSPSG